MKLVFIDEKKAHLNATCDEEEWVALPDEFEEFGRYAKRQRWLYGMRKGGRTRAKTGGAAPTIFYHPKTQVRVVVHR